MKNRFFTILFLPSNPSKVKKMILSEYLMRSLAISAIILVFAFSVVFLDYVNVKKKEVDLTSLKEQTKIQNVQLQTFGDKINDLEAELERLRSLDTKIRTITNTNLIEEPKAKSGRLSLGGRGGHDPAALSFKNETLLKGMMGKLDKLSIEANTQENSLHELHASLEERKAVMSSIPSRWPVRGYVSSDFGHRESPFGGKSEVHEGMDISAPAGTPIVAAASGTVTFAGRYYDLGNAVTIDHGYGYVTTYGHLSKITAHAGQTVKGGQKIGAVGSTGRSTGPHLHYELQVAGSKVNPRNYLN